MKTLKAQFSPAVFTSEKFRAYLALGMVCFFWGTTYLALRVGVKTIPPFLFSGFRMTTAGIILALILIARGYKLPKWWEFLIHAGSGILMISFGNGIVTWAEKYVSSGLTALICSSVPFWIILLNLLVRNSERLNLKVLLGLVLGLLGLVLIFGDSLKDFGVAEYKYGIIGIFIANLCWAIGTVATKNVKKEAHPLLAAGLQMFSGGSFLLVTSLFTESPNPAAFSVESLAALVYLIMFGSILAFGAYIYALSKLPATVVSMYAYINPLVALVLGWLILNETLNLTTMIAFGFIVSGVFFVNRGSKPKS